MSETTTPVDWNEVWREKMLLNIESRGGLDCTQYWHSREEALKYDSLVRKDNWKKARERLSDIELKPDMRVLDIGAGTGSLAIPLAQQVKHVTAVEPSDTMRWCLERNIREAAMDNVSIVAKRWEDIDPERDLEPPYDLVIASYSLGMLDIREAVVKMSRASSGTVYLFWFAETDGCCSVLWDCVFGRKYLAKPQADVLFNVLYKLGYEVNISIREHKSRQYFKSLDDAYDEYRKEFRIEDDAPRCSKLMTCLREMLQCDGQGLFLESRNRSARIWWAKG